MEGAPIHRPRKPFVIFSLPERSPPPLPPSDFEFEVGLFSHRLALLLFLLGLYRGGHATTRVFLPSLRGRREKLTLLPPASSS